LASAPPRSPAVANTPVSVPSLSAGARESVGRAGLESIGPAYFATLGIPLVRGAEFTGRDLRFEPAPGDILPAIINQTAARELFGGADPLGRRIRQKGEDFERDFQVVGVVPYDDSSAGRDGARHIAGGRHRLRRLLYMPTLGAATQHNPVLKAYYQRLRAKGKSAKVAIIACMHKLLIILNTMMAKRQHWRTPEPAVE